MQSNKPGKCIPGRTRAGEEEEESEERVKKVKCKACYGTGSVDIDRICRKCEGSGERVVLTSRAKKAVEEQLAKLATRVDQQEPPNAE